MSDQQEIHQKTNQNLNEKSTPQEQPQNQQMGVSAIEELELQVSDEDDRNQINKILYQYLLYPSSQLAALHQEANRLGTRDITSENLKKQEEKTKQDEEMALKAQYCPCCGYVKQEDQLKVCHPLDDISNLGISTFLYFQTIKNLTIILVQMFLIYGIYALATNIIASGKFDDCGTTVSYAQCTSNLDYLTISLGSKQTNQTDQNKNFYYIQAWLGVLMVLIWFVTFFFLKYFEKSKEIEVDSETISASDFTIVFENIPDDFTQEQLQKQLSDYEATITQVPAKIRKPLTIRKFNKGKPFYLNQEELKDEQLTKLQEEQYQMINTMAQWILERQDSHTFSTTKEQRQQFYKKYQDNLTAQQERMQELSKKIKEKISSEQGQKHLTVAFATLDSNYAKDVITTLNPSDVSAKVRNFITCGTISNPLKLTHNGQRIDVRVQRAPQPEDVIWANIGMTDWQKFKRKLITYTVTLILLGISFAAVYGLSTAQINNQNDSYLSTIISLMISLINVIISQVIRRLSLYERDYTSIKHQTSLAIKSVLAQLINSIVVPIIANYFIKDHNLYDKGGLADDVFMLGLTNALVTPILKYFDGYYFFTRVMAWYYDRPNSKLYINQNVLNALYTNIQFQIGFEYIYIVNLFLFVCFFVSLQPIIVVFALIGYGLMYWSQKWSLFNRMKRPVPGNDLVNSAMGQLIFLGPMVYSLGSLTWSNFFPGGIPESAIVPNLIALIISVIIGIFPLSLIFSCCFDQNVEPELKYDQNRIYFAAQYDRLNPATAQQGFKDYMSFIENYGKSMQNATDEEKQKIAKQLDKNARRGSSSGANMPFAQGMQAFLRPQQRGPNFMGGLIPGMMPPRQNAPMNPFMPMMQPQQQQPMFVPQQSVMQQQMPPMQSGFQQPMQPQMQPQMQRVPQPFGFQPQQQMGGFGFRPQIPGFQQPGFQQPGFQQLGFQQPGFGQPFNPFGNFRR